MAKYFKNKETSKAEEPKVMRLQVVGCLHLRNAILLETQDAFKAALDAVEKGLTKRQALLKQLVDIFTW